MKNEEASKQTRRNSKIELQKAAVGYETAVQLWAAESQNRMSNYNAGLVANSLILAALGFSYQDSSSYYQLVKLFLTYLGIVLCTVWYISERRMLRKAVYYMYSAREIEGKYFGGVFDVLNRGARYSKGKQVEFLIEGQLMYRKIEPLIGLKSQWAFGITILIFVFIYLLVLIIEHTNVIRLSL